MIECTLLHLLPHVAMAGPRRSSRLRVMAKVAVRMLLHDKLKLAGTLFGVIFAVVLADQQLGVFLALMAKNTMLVDEAGADVWILPRATEWIQPGKPVPMAALYRARALPEAAWAEPLLLGAGTVSLPSGGSEAVSILGARGPRWRGGPWNLVAGSAEALAQPDTMIFEDSVRQELGGLNLGSVREVNGHRVLVGGFTWGLLPFGPSYAFAEYDTARTLLATPADETSFVLVGARAGVDATRLRARLQAELPGVDVLTARELHLAIVRHLLRVTGMGITFGTATTFGLLVGLVIVALTMFSAVVDNIREFGTLKAIGCRNRDLALLLMVQSVACGSVGSLIGLGLVSQMSEGMRSPKMAMILPWQLYAATVVLMVGLCTAASLLALLRIRQVEPAMVFR